MREWLSKIDIKKLFHEYYRYIIVGLIVTAMDYALLIIMKEVFGVYYLTAACISYVVANVTQYICCAKYVFPECPRPMGLRGFSMFFILGLIGLAILYAIMYVLVEKFQVYYLLAKVVVSGATFTFNFLTRRFIVFKY